MRKTSRKWELAEDAKDEPVGVEMWSARMTAAFNERNRQKRSIAAAMPTRSAATSIVVRGTRAGKPDVVLGDTFG